MNQPAAIDSLVTETEQTAGTAPSEEAKGLLLHMPVDIRSASLVLIAVLASLFTLHWAKAVFIPMLLGSAGSYALTPLVDRMERWRMPARARLGTAAGAPSSRRWAGPVTAARRCHALIESLPDVAQRVRQSLERSAAGPASRSTGSPIDKVQQAAAELEKAAQTNAASPTTRGVTRVQIEKARFNVMDYFWTGTLGLVTLAGQATVVFFLTFFLLASGTTFRRKMVKIAGPTFSEKKLTVQALDEITEQIQRYLLVTVFTSLLVAVATWLAFVWLEVEHAAVWGLVAGVLNFIPYIGSIIFTGASAAIGFVQFESLEAAVMLAGRVARAPHDFGLRPDAVAHQPRQPDERGDRFRRRPRLGLALGRLGLPARRADPDGRQSGLRPRREPQADR
jgi:predicted PurR-regulated permease PerM